jgi:LysM repeat protein
MRLIDLTKKSMGWNHPFQTRTTNQIRNIGIHHSATNAGSQTVFENHWRNLGWRNGGYSEIILRNGDVEICYAPTTITNGVGGHNLNTYHIGVVGNSSFTAAQERSLIERVRFNMNQFQIPIERVLGHNEFSGHTSNICPGRNMDTLRRNLRVLNVSNSKPGSNAAHTVRNGETLSGIARQHRTTVAELQRLNNLTNANLIRVGQALRLPSGASNSQTNNSNSNQIIRVGSRVRVNNNAQSWSTGQSIPTWVRGKTYTVGQMRNNNNELLLSGIMSWIRRGDVTPV